MSATASTGLEPGNSFYRRPLPEGLIAFASPEGRRLFREALEAGGMEGWFALAEQFHTQADPAFCGLGTLVVALNALEIDPGRIWKGPWRWYGEDLLDCCLPLEQVRQKGITLDELACLARCNGATARAVRADATAAGAGPGDLRETVRAASAAPRGPVLVAGYSRSLLGQTGSGHFSPVAGYHPGRDLALILDVARFKYPPHWVPLEQLWRAMTAVDPATSRARGWIVLERDPSRFMPLLFRLSAADGLAPLASALLDEAPGLLATAPGESPQALVTGWVAAVEVHLGPLLCQSMGPLTSTPERLPPEHRAAVEILLAELHATAAYQAVVRARPPGVAARVPDAVLATLLLALPDEALTPLPALNRLALAALREVPAPSVLASEIASLREQMLLLRQWRSGR